MGRALAKSQQKRFRPKMNGSSRGAGMAMAPGTTSIGVDGEHDKTMLSILEVDDLTDFLGQAEMANREFVSEREQFLVLDEAGSEVRPESDARVTWEDQPRKKNDFVFKELAVPRRPTWDESTTAAELDQKERDYFVDWRRAIAAREEQLLESDNVRVTPFEKNLEVWRQLWRVMERCSCIIQIVDARNPMFYLSSDLRSYAVEELGKPMLLLINKSDYLSESQRRSWHEYFTKQGWDHLFFSAWQEQEKLDNAAAEERKQAREAPTNPFGDDDLEVEGGEDDPLKSSSEEKSNVPAKDAAISQRESIGIESPLTRQELMDWIHSFSLQYHCEPDPRFDNRVQFGMVGFPNVGKSSVINVLVGSSKHSHGLVRVGVASQPGKTKHFQTLFLPDRDDIMLCDCPGLVFPSFVSSTADLIAAGVYPIAQMRDHWPVVELICRRIPREILNANYGIHLPFAKDLANRDIVKPPTAEDLLTTYCVARSMLAASSGVPDFQRAARIIIKDYADGKLLYCHSPPNTDTMTFQRETIGTVLNRTQKLQEKLEDVLQKQKPEKDQDADNSNTPDVLDGIEDDLDILEAMEGFGVSEVTPNGGKRGKSHKSMHKWGKKGRKNRNKDPYGCHSNPDAMLDGTEGASGAVVMGGKYSKKGYTRPTNYSGTRGVTQFEIRTKMEKSTS